MEYTFDKESVLAGLNVYANCTYTRATFANGGALLLKQTGKAMLAWIALAYLFWFVSGIILWWPKRWPPSFKIALRQGLLRGLFDIHRLGGAVLGLRITVSAAIRVRMKLADDPHPNGLTSIYLHPKTGGSTCCPSLE